MPIARATLWLLIVGTMTTLAKGFPAPQEDDNSSGPLPFLQFTKGGIRVNFGGYHAQAGLGGLLTGSKADGGLHASAGTPDGAHASAGLGGSLNGGPAGGLHARAGLGNGGPEAEAGLGGTLAGPRPRGELYAKSSTSNNGPAAKARLAGTLDEPRPRVESYAGVSPGNNNWIERQETNGKNIQVIARPKKASEQEASASASANANSGLPVANLKRQRKLERRLLKERRRQEYKAYKDQWRRSSLDQPPELHLSQGFSSGPLPAQQPMPLLRAVEQPPQM